MATGYSGPCAIQIIDIEDGLTLNTDLLRQFLLRDEIKDKKVCVVAIAGAFRQGKSFLLNLFIRYLTKASRGTRDLTRWLTPEDGPVSGFMWRGGSDVVTTGIAIWSEVFIVEDPSGEEVTVLLMDTQGAFDNEMTMRNCATIFALSTLLSSVQIYNLMNNIKSSDLSYLQFFLGYGQLLRESGNEIPFQNLLFLVRDWSSPEQYPYGMAGGKYLLDKVLNTANQNLSTELMVLREGIKELFKEINCFLLPHPGLPVTNFKFNGSLNEISQDFLSFVQILTSKILSAENLVPKVINGEFIKVKNLVDLFEQYCEQFKSNDVPEVESLFMATVNAQHSMALDDAEAVYDKWMAFVKNPDLEGIDESMLQQEHEHCKNTAIDNFRAKRLMGDGDIKAKNIKILQTRLNEKFSIYHNINKLKRQKEEQAKMQVRLDEQQEEIENLEVKVTEEEALRRSLMEQHQRAFNVHQEQLSSLKRILEEERERMEEAREEQKEKVEEQRRKIADLEDRLLMERRHIERLEEQRTQIQNGSLSVLQEIDRADDPASKLVKGAMAVGYGVASVVDGIASSLVRILPFFRR